MAWQPKVNRHVTYIRASGELQPATITAIVAENVLNLRIGHGEVITNVPKQDSRGETNVWRVADEYIGAAVPLFFDLLQANFGLLLQANGGRILL
jgi:hypothetical protein